MSQKSAEQKEKIRQLQQQKKAAQKELDALRGNTPKGKAITTVAFLVVLAVLFGIFVLLVKLNVGGVADKVLAPAIADVPVARSILPHRMQKKNAKEIAADKKAKAAAKKAAQDKKKQEKAAAAAAKASAKAAEKANAKATAEAKKQARASAKASADAQKQADLSDYVDTYANMDPAQAAKIFDGMMAGDAKLVARILKNMPAKKRSAILANMNVLSAEQVTQLLAQ